MLVRHDDQGHAAGPRERAEVALVERARVDDHDIRVTGLGQQVAVRAVEGHRAGVRREQSAREPAAAFRCGEG